MRLISRALGSECETFDWCERPAIYRVGATTPSVLKALARSETATDYGARVKPFNFLLGAVPDPLAREARGGELHLVAPYERNPRKWLRARWVDVCSGERVRVSTTTNAVGDAIRVKTYGDVLTCMSFIPRPRV